MSMMDKLARADRWLIETVFEPAAQKIEHGSGADNFTVANAILVIWPAATGALALKYQTADRWVVLGFVFLISAWRYLWVVWLAQRTRREVANIDKLAAQPWRLMQSASILIFTPFTLWFGFGFGLGDLGSAALWTHLYLCACDRPPPQEEREPLFARRMEV